MPYAPTERNDPSPLFNGIAGAGRAIADGMEQANKNKQDMDNLELSARLLAKTHPDVIDPATVEKFSKGGLGQRKALVGEMTAAVANKFRTQSQGMEQQRISLAGENIQTDRARIAEQARQHDTPSADATARLSAVGQWDDLPLPTGGKMFVNRGTGQAIPVKPPVPESPVEEVPLSNGVMAVRTGDGQWTVVQPKSPGLASELADVLGGNNAPASGSAAAGTGPAKTPAPAKGAPQKYSRAAWDAAPSGSRFLAPDGSIRRKP